MTFDRVNLAFTFLVFACGGIAGSAASGLVVGAAAWAIARIAARSFPLTRDRVAWLAASIVSTVFIADTVSLVAHRDLAYLFSHSRTDVEKCLGLAQALKNDFAETNCVPSVSMLGIPALIEFLD